MLGAELATDPNNIISYNNTVIIWFSEGECVLWANAIKICMLLKDSSYKTNLQALQKAMNFSTKLWVK